MKVEWVRIKNFRSIKDTGKLYIDSNLTVLAGQNESGKSNILRALEAFSSNKFSSKNYPEGIDKNINSPTVEVCFKVNLSTLKPYLRKKNDYYKAKGDISFTYIVKKDLARNKQITYGTIQNVFLNLIPLGILKDLINNLTQDTEKYNFPRSMVNELYRKVQILLDGTASEELLIVLEDIANKLVVLLNIEHELGEERLEFYIPEREERLIPNDIIEPAVQVLQTIDLIVREYHELEKKLSIPKFIMMDSFEKLLPDSIRMLNGDEEDIWFRYVYTALELNGKTNLFEIPNRDLRRRIERFSNEITTLFQRVYTQSSIQLELDIGMQNVLNLYIYDPDSDIDFFPSQRSKGFQWFLSFFFAINAVKEEQNIILIDEPGPYLHPKAQKDVLKALEIITESNQIIFTTHSPYLIDPNSLERIRLVIRGEDNHTTIENRIHAPTVANQDVYTPIITAIGLDLSGSFGTFGEYNTIVEGISDYYYLECMKKHITNIDEFGEMRFIPSIGASQIDKLASLLIGWGVQFKVLLDNDKAGETERKELEQKLFLSEEQIVFVSDEPGFAIEDLFSKEDFLQHVRPDLKISERDEQLKNSNLLRGNSKALIAKMFKEKAQKEKDLKFTPQTIDNFTKLFHKLYGVNHIKVEVMENV
ncbi:endonuclease [Bacillus pseudomycoides]|uniref:Endonuclease n=1 Tax=Bacillus pseudomycoides TaxID=64104 RepID=A0A1Y3M7I0_9BACI|nr:AAA family ATPase [Bacillus pseudomycoides]OUM46377.1 endonuclease [Bacillus pseudomycoides]